MEACRALCGSIGCLLTWADAHATALVAIIAVAFTFWQIRVAREHNRLSVRPRLVLWLDSSTELDGHHTTTVIAKNLGLGPAYVRKIEYLFNGTAVDVRDASAVQEAMHAAFGERWAKAWPLVDLRDVLPIPKDGELPLMKVQTDAAGASLSEDLEKLRQRFKTVIEYLSPYDEVLRVAGSAAGRACPMCGFKLYNRSKSVQPDAYKPTHGSERRNATLLRLEFAPRYI